MYIHTYTYKLKTNEQINESKILHIFHLPVFSTFYKSTSLQAMFTALA